jgi:hypothetical protein
MAGVLSFTIYDGSTLLTTGLRFTIWKVVSCAPDNDPVNWVPDAGSPPTTPAYNMQGQAMRGSSLRYENLRCASRVFATLRNSGSQIKEFWDLRYATKFWVPDKRVLGSPLRYEILGPR